MPAPDFLSQRERLNDEIADHFQPKQEAFMTIYSEITKLTPAKARQLIDGQINNRPHSKARVAFYAKEMELGRWAMNGQAIIVTKAGKMIDGQHRCMAVIESGVTIEVLVIRGVSESNYDLIDQGMPRSVSDVLGGVANYNTVAAGLRILYREHIGVSISSSTRMTPRDGLDLLKKHPGMITSASWVAGHASIKKMLRSGASTYCHYRAGKISESVRDIFFDRLADGVGLSAKSPILGLRNALVAATGQKLTEQHQLALIILAFSYYRVGKHVSYIRYSPAAGQSFPSWEG